VTKPALTLLNLVLLGLLALGTVLAFLVVPTGGSLPVHWNIHGEADGFAPARVALLLPGAMGAVIVGLLVFVRPFARKDFEAGRHVIEATVNAILGLALLLLAATMAIGLGQPVDMPRLIAAALGIMLIVLGNYLPKTQPNAVAGVRLPWTLRDSANWRATHLWTGRLLMLGGLVSLVAAILNPPSVVLFAVMLSAAAVPALAGILISYRLSRR
jgi:uncharacterized membrane protein